MAESWTTIPCCAVKKTPMWLTVTGWCLYKKLYFLKYVLDVVLVYSVPVTLSKPAVQRTWRVNSMCSLLHISDKEFFEKAVKVWSTFDGAGNTPFKWEIWRWTHKHYHWHVSTYKWLKRAPAFPRNVLMVRIWFIRTNFLLCNHILILLFCDFLFGDVFF